MSASGTPSPRIDHSEIFLRSWRGPAAVTAATAGALTFDALSPQVVSVTVGYMGLVLIGYWLPSPRAPLALALLATPLIIIGHWISIPEGTPEWQSWLNRSDSLGSVWLTAVFVWRIRVLEQERKQSEAQVSILAREAEHRARNVLGNVKAMVQLSQSDTPKGLKEAIKGRIEALANVHSLFAQSRWTGAELGRLVQQELSPYSRDGKMRTRIDGPSVILNPKAAQSIAVALHELATNAAKYGALSGAKGKVRVECRARQTDGSCSAGSRQKARL